VAFDRHGDLAAATSTGGTPQKLGGRVGDTPLIGAGTFADNALGAASSTGWGESIIKVVLAKTACDFLPTSKTVFKAAQKGIKVLQEKVAGRGGVIMISNKGEIGYSFNTPRMAFAYLDSNMPKEIVGI
jgi:L-asparaginase / beta-aspartyl-peptidase